MLLNQLHLALRLANAQQVFVEMNWQTGIPFTLMPSTLFKAY